MKLEDQICSLELAKRLKELGVPQESFFYWQYDGPEFGHSIGIGYPKIWISSGLHFSAFTTSELGEMLPKRILDENKLEHCLIQEWLPESVCTGNEISVHPWLGYTMGVSGTTRLASVCHAEANSEVDARAKMLIYLIEEGLVKP